MYADTGLYADTEVRVRYLCELLDQECSLYEIMSRLDLEGQPYTEYKLKRDVKERIAKINPDLNPSTILRKIYNQYFINSVVGFMEDKVYWRGKADDFHDALFKRAKQEYSNGDELDALLAAETWLRCGRSKYSLGQKMRNSRELLKSKGITISLYSKGQYRCITVRKEG